MIARGSAAPLAPLLEPRSIAIVGATEDPTRVGGMPIHYLKQAGYPGAIFPVSLNRASVQGMRAYRSVGEIGEEIDMALVVVPADGTPAVVRDCAAAGISVAVVLGGGFAEVGLEGAALQDELTTIARETGIRICGPNCAGVMNIPGRVPATFGSHLAGDQTLVEGPISIVSQSGAVGAYIFSLARQRGVGLQYWVTTGNEVDIEVGEVAAALASHEGTRVIALYAEQFRDPDALANACELAHMNGKGVVAILAGRTAASERALQSHTASILGDRDVVVAALAEFGVAIVDSIDDLLVTSVGLAAVRRPRGRGVGLVSISGGVGILMVDRCVERGLTLPPMSVSRQARMKALLPYAATENPADVTGNISNDPDVFSGFIDLVLEAEEIDVVLCFLGHIVLSPKVGRRFVDELIELSDKHDKPVWLIAMDDDGWVSRRASAAGMTLVQDPVAAVDALSVAARVEEWLADRTRSRIWDRRRRPASPAPGQGIAAEGGVLTELQAQPFIEEAGISLPAQVVVTSPDVLPNAADALREPLVMKIVADELVHKSDFGGVALDVARDDLVAAYQRLTDTVARHAPYAELGGVVVQEQVDGVQVIVGTMNDPAFGPVVRVGEGGLDAESASGGAIALAPVDIARAAALVATLSSYDRLRGTRGRDQLDLDELRNVVVRVSQLAWENRALVETIEINPLVVTKSGAVAVDALIELRDPEPVMVKG